MTMCYSSNRKLICHVTFHLGSSQFVLVCFVCHKKVPKAGWHKQEKYILTVLETGSLRSRGQQSWFLLRALRENLFQASVSGSGGLLAAFGIPWVVEVSITLIFAFIFTCHFPCVHICAQIFLFYKNIIHIGLGPTPMTSA